MHDCDLVSGNDSSFSIYHAGYKQSYHERRLGAYSETLYKHLLPSAIFMESRLDFESRLLDSMSSLRASSLKGIHPPINEVFRFYPPPLGRPIRVLDICFGLGFSSFMAFQNFPCCEIYSPEKELILERLKTFPYPATLAPLAYKALEDLSLSRMHASGDRILHLLEGDALKIMASFPPGFFDVVFQDAFSRDSNSELWSEGYFRRLYDLMASRAVVTTYARAKGILQTARNTGFRVIKHALGSVFYKG